MDKRRKTTHAIFFLISALLIRPVKPDPLAYFVESKMSEFTNWLTQNNLDPSPVLEGPTNLDLSTIVFDLKFELRNIVAEGHSTGQTIRHVSAQLSRGSFDINFDISDRVSFSGEYTVNGTLLPDKPVSYLGAWRLTVPYAHYNYLNSAIQINPSGHFDLSYLSVNFELADLEDVYFESLSENLALVGYNQVFQQKLREEFEYYLSTEDSSPLVALHQRYWQEVFAETTFEDIMGATPIPSTPLPTETTGVTSGTSSTSTTTILPSTPSPNYQLRQFVERKMANYASWLRSNNLDPSPLVSGPSYIRAWDGVTKLDCYLENHGIQGHSASSPYFTVRADFENRWFYVDMNMAQGVKFFGNYKANGSVHSCPFGCSSLSGEGSWFIYQEELYSRFNISFDVDPSGYLNVSSYDLSKVKLSIDEDFESEVFFENILESEAADGYEDSVEEAMVKGFNNYLKNDRVNAEHPVRSLYLQYWRETLSETTIGDILG